LPQIVERTFDLTTKPPAPAEKAPRKDLALAGNIYDDGVAGCDLANLRAFDRESLVSRVNPESIVQWLSFHCPLCKARLRIKAAYAHLRGRCPECGGRIEALRPLPPAPPVSPSDSEEPLGLMPIEEEWPEPAEIEGDSGGAYGISTAAPPPTMARETPLPPGKGYGLAQGLEARPRSKVRPPEADPYAVLPADATVPPAELHLSPGEAEQYRPRPKPVAHTAVDLPILESFLFPLRRRTLGTWLFLSFDLMVLGTVATLYAVIPVMGPVIAAGLGIVFLPASLYAASCFFVIVEDTSAGSDEVTWPEAAGLVDGWARLFHLFWVFACCALPIAIIWQAGIDALWTGDLWWLVPLVMLLFLFPVLSLSSMAASSRWLIFDRAMLARMLSRPLVLPVLWLASALVAIPVVALIFMALLKPGFQLALGAGAATATGLLIYARQLGWAGRRLTRENRKKQQNKGTDSRHRSQVTDLGGWGPDEDSEVSQADSSGE
jgi:hypothetical protein